jgi:hypothetical protein
MSIASSPISPYIPRPPNISSIPALSNMPEAPIW